MLFKKRGVVLITLIIWIIIIGAIVIYGPRLYNWYVEQNEIKIIKSNVESVENEIKSELIEKHSILIWPVTKEPQIRNGWSSPGDVVVYFDGKETFTLDGVGPDGNMLHLNIVIKK